MEQGYYRHPTIAGDVLVFVCEDDLWTVSAAGGIPRRLTAGVGESSHPHLSPDGRWLAYTAREEGHEEVYVMPAGGGPSRRLTFLGATSFVAGWRPDGRSILFASNSRQPFVHLFALFSVPPDGGEPELLPWGPARHVSFGPKGGVVLGRNTHDSARWKRYRGGITGDLWIDRKGSGRFERLNDRLGNPTTPLWVGDRIYFLDDSEGYGNLYSCREDGSDVGRHTDHDAYYARHATTDGRRIAYHAGADVYVFDPANERTALVSVEWRGHAPQRSRKFVSAAEYLEDAILHPSGEAVALTTRGKLFVMGVHAGPVVQIGEPQSVRYRLPDWLPDGQRLVAVTDAPGEEALVVFPADGTQAGDLIDGLDLGRIVALAAAPRGERVAIANHRHQLIVVDLATRRAQVLDRSPVGLLAGMAWSPDGSWVAYGFPDSPKTTCIKMANVVEASVHRVTEPILHDTAPAFDPSGDYLFFLSERVFDPVYDNLHFDLGFPKGVRPCLVTLRSSLVSPLERERSEEDREASPSKMDLDGISHRLVVLPVPESLYDEVLPLRGKVLLVSSQPAGALAEEGASGTASSSLESYDYRLRKHDTLAERLTQARISRDGRSVLLRVGDRLRVLPAGEGPPENADDEPGRESGWIDLERVRVSIDPRSEWRQMYHEAWRLQRDQFWTEDMSAVDWKRAHSLYLPLLDRVATRSEFSDLLWEMQGELGTSHAYEFGGDYRATPRYEQGLLGADWVYDAPTGGYRLVHIVRGDAGEPDQDSPLNRLGVDIRVGDILVAVAGQRLSAALSPGQALVHLARVEVQLAFAGRDGGPERTVTVRTLRTEWPARYREWVEANRRRVHEASAGRLGYVHVPDMGPAGFAEFHRGFLTEVLRDGLILDVRFTAGGHVAPLILERLGRRRLGYRVERWGGVDPYPEDSRAGPLVAVTNEHAGSDGDIFAHCFKLLGLGPLVGRRTWGGAVAIWPRHALVDGTMTTQPEYSFWFDDVGWGLENRGTDPDVEVDITPNAHASGEDTQLEQAITLALEALARSPTRLPDLSARPRLAPPKLPPREP
ncbi:MAG: PDZ domain-containing protein [Acidobacteria bacterium]|nr:PDZ domain-containing protein [Acidobacteriota bacterium]